MSGVAVPMAVRVWPLVQMGDRYTCWPWRGLVDRHGYGKVGSTGAHRVAYELTYGPIPTGLLVMHTCDNPPCCNPLHLRTGTQADNLADMTAKGRTGPRKRKVSDAEVREILVRARTGETTVAELAAEYGVSRRLVRYIVVGRRRSRAAA